MRSSPLVAILLSASVATWGSGCADASGPTDDVGGPDAPLDATASADVTTASDVTAPVPDAAPFADGADASGAELPPPIPDDFHVPGTQIGEVDAAAYLRPGVCGGCHGGSGVPDAPFSTWRGSLMANAGRDPLFFAQLATASQDVPGVGTYCVRCHVPMAVATGHVAYGNESALDDVDRDGVSCHFCHSMIDPLADASTVVAGDPAVLASLADPPKHYGNAAFVLDPNGLRRGPYADAAPPHPATTSPFVERGALAAGESNAIAMVQRAAALSLSAIGGAVRARVVNRAGHKIPTGHIEGRRMWLDVVFTDGSNATVGEIGRWDPATGDLDASATTVFEMQVGLSPQAAKATGLDAGVTTHMALADLVVKDNRIPPQGFANAAYDAVGAGAVGATYADGQNWADVDFPIPSGAKHARVTLWYQTVTREYVEALKSGNHTDAWGTTLYGLWQSTGKNAPIAAATGDIDLP